MSLRPWIPFVNDDRPLFAGLLVLVALSWGAAPAAHFLARYHPVSPKVLSVATASAALQWTPASHPTAAASGVLPFVPGQRAVPGWVGLLLGVPLNLSLASAADLDALPGVGPATAEEIIRLRRVGGGLKSVDGLLGARGVGPKALERLKPWVCVHADP